MEEISMEEEEQEAEITKKERKEDITKEEEAKAEIEAAVADMVETEAEEAQEAVVNFNQEPHALKLLQVQSLIYIPITSG